MESIVWSHRRQALATPSPRSSQLKNCTIKISRDKALDSQAANRKLILESKAKSPLPEAFGSPRKGRVKATARSQQHRERIRQYEAMGIPTRDTIARQIGIVQL